MASSLEVMKDFKYAEYCRYITMTNLQVVTFAVVMNLDRWNALPKKIQDEMEALKREQAEWTGRYVDEHVTEAVEWSKETYKVEVIEFSKDETKKMNTLLSPLVEGYIKRTESKVPARQVIDDIRKFMANYEEKYR
jgi:TRAP-type C4-dicarboxylate transport system substrate-binding protein